MRYSTDARSLGTYDVVVCGGGPTGVCAAIAAAEEGRRVLLVEGMGQLGGIGTSGLVSHWLGGRDTHPTRWVVGGLFRRLSVSAASKGIALLPEPEPDGSYSPHGWTKRGSLVGGVAFEPFEMALHLEEAAVEAGVDLLYFTRVVDAVTDGSRIATVILHNKSGFLAVSASVFVDATGDADVAEYAGCPTQLGREEDRLMTPVTLQVHMDGIDEAALKAYIDEHDAFRFLDEIEEWTRSGEWPFIYNRFISVKMPGVGTFMVNTPRITGVDGTDGAAVTNGMIQGRKEIFMLRDFMRTHIPGCEKARVKAVGSSLGVRETRRIRGEFHLSVNDVIDGTAFEDAIAYSCYGWDLPDPNKPSYQPMSEKFKAPRHTPIPYRVMIPQKVDNLICSGRMISVERDVLGPLRVMGPCMGMGEAAGVAAAFVASGNAETFGKVDTESLRARLRERGVILEGHDTEMRRSPEAGVAER